jgi:N-acetylglucosaminyldiphosphoundecaprenol N-acetyl-beta-D-mannosaminyltransferase
MPRTIRLFGLDFADLNLTQTAAWLSQRPSGDPFGYVVTPNADHLVRLNCQADLAMLYDNAMLRLLDSRVVGKLARLLGLRVPPVTPGSDLTALILRHHLHAGERITIIGLPPKHLPTLIQNCGIAPPAHYNPPKGFEHNPSELAGIVQFVLANPARFVLLAVGCPRQEILAAAIQATNQATGIGLCIGASLDFLSGAAKRAPIWMQQAGLEWLHRLASNPRRFARRYLRDCPAIVPLLLREWRKERRRGALPRQR